MFKKGTQAAKNYMAKLRAAKGKSKPKKLGALPVGFIGKMWGVQFKVQNQFDIYNNVQCICENKITGEQFCIINGIKKDVPNQVAKFYDHILQNTDVSINDSDLKILGILKKDITKFVTNLSNEVDKYNKGQKVTSPVKNINIPKPTTLKKIKVSANKKIQINDIKGKPIKKKGNTLQQWEFAGVHNKNKSKLLGISGLNFNNKNMINNLGYGEVYDTSFQIYLVKFTNLSFQLWAVTGEGLKKAINHPAGKGQKPIVYIVKSYGIPKFEKMKISELKKFI